MKVTINNDMSLNEISIFFNKVKHFRNTLNELKNKNNKISFINIYKIKQNKKASKILFERIINDDYIIFNLYEDLYKINLKNDLENFCELFITTLIIKKDFFFLIEFYIILNSLYSDFHKIFNKKIKYFFENLIKLDLINNLKQINKINFFLLINISLMIIGLKIEFKYIFKYLNFNLNKILENKKFKNQDEINILLKIFCYLIPLISIDLYNLKKNNYFLEIENYKINDKLLPIKIETNEEIIIRLRKLILKFFEILQKISNKTIKNFNESLNIIENELKKKFIIDIKIRIENDKIYKNILYFKDLFKIFNLFFNLNIEFLIENNLLEKRKNLVKDFNLSIREEFYLNNKEYSDFKILEILKENNSHLKHNSNNNNEYIKNIIPKIKKCNSILASENLSILLLNCKNQTNNYLIQIIDEIDNEKNIYFQSLIISNILIADKEASFMFIKWLNEFYIKFTENNDLNNSQIIKIKLIIYLIKFGSINPKLIICLLFKFLPKLNNKNIYFILKLVNNCKNFFKFLEYVNLVFIEFFKEFNISLKKNTILFNKYQEKIHKLNLEFGLKINRTKVPKSLIILNFIEKQLSNLNKKNEDLIIKNFKKLPISLLINEISELFVKLIEVSGYKKIKQLTLFIYKIQIYYPEIKIKFLDNILENILNFVENKFYENKQLIINYCITVSYSYNSKLIDESDYINYLYNLISFNQNNQYLAYYKNFDKGNSFPILMVCNSLRITKKYFKESDNMFLFFLYLQIYILNLNYLDLNIEIQVREIFSEFNKKFKILNTLNKAQEILNLIHLFENGNTQYNSIQEILLIDDKIFLETRRKNELVEEEDHNLNLLKAQKIEENLNKNREKEAFFDFNKDLEELIN